MKTNLRRPATQVWGVRVIALSGSNIFVVKHSEDTKEFWLLPGGGIHVGESIEEAGAREMAEETGLYVLIKSCLYVREFPDNTEFYVLAEVTGGNMKVGHDPDKTIQVLMDIRELPVCDLRECEITFYPLFLKERLASDLEIGPPSTVFVGAAQ